MEPNTQFKQCPRCKQPAPLHAPTCASCGRQFRTQFGPQQYERTVVFNQSPPADDLIVAPARIEPEPYPAQPTQQYYPPQYAPPQHPPVYVHPYETPRQVNDICATLSVVFGAISLALFCFFGWTFAVVGLALGAVALVRIRSNPQTGGQSLAILGIALSLPAFLFGSYFLFLWLMAVLTTPTTR